MERIDKVAQQISIKATSTDSKPYEKVLDKARLQRIFALMQATYGSLWVNNVGTNELLKISFEVWGKKLAGLTDDQIKNGLDNLPEDYPPTPVKFHNLCVGTHAGISHNTAAYKPIDKALRLEKKADKQKAREALNKIRGIIE